MKICKNKKRLYEFLRSMQKYFANIITTYDTQKMK